MKLLMLLIFSNLMLNQSFAQTFSFWGNKQVQKTMSQNMTYTEGVNLQEFEEMFSKTTTELRRQYVQEAIELMQMGASGAQALNMVLSFDDRVFDRRRVAKKGLGTTLMAAFRAGVESFYQANYQINNRKLQISNELNTNYSAHLHYGIYPTKKGKSALYIFLELTNNENYLTRSFYVKALASQIGMLGQALAAQVLHDLHKTEYPLKTRLGRNEVIVNLTHLDVAVRVQVQDQIRNARQLCKSLNSRLINKNEIEILMARGIYNGGHSKANLSRLNYIFEKGIYRQADPFANQIWNPWVVPAGKRTMVFCIDNN